MLKKISIYLSLTFLSFACSLELPVVTSKSIKQCTFPSNIIVTNPESSNLSKIVLSIDGNSSDVTNVAWKISLNGSEVFTSNQLSPTTTLNQEGTFTINCKVTTSCGTSTDLPSKSYSNIVKTCTNATSISAIGTSGSLNLSINGSTSDIASVIWTINNNGTTIYTSGSITASPFSVVPSAITTSGNLTVVATITDKCQKQYLLNTNFINCTKATGISVTPLSTTESPLDLNLKLNGNTSDIVSVLWLITENTKEVYKKTISDSPFSILSTSTLSLSGSVGDYLITAKITDKCGQTYDLSFSYSYPIPNALRVSMVSVEGGTFSMGSNEFALDERPIHSVTLKNFFIGKYEVTISEWKEVMGTTTPSYFASCEKCPVESVTWQETQIFIEKLNKLTGKTYRLPTEAEWEYAGRGGKKSKGYLYSGSSNIDDVAWYSANGKGKTQLVGQKGANELEIFDMSGNVWEWCNDIYAPYTSEHQNNPTGPSSGAGHVLRGGSWNDSPNYSRMTVRFNDVDRGAIRNDSGFRLVLVP